jgi:quercetin dioxygenase-like cupin family protein
MSSRIVTQMSRSCGCKGKMDFRLGSEQRGCGQGDVVVIPGGTEHEAWFREDT